MDVITTVKNLAALTGWGSAKGLKSPAATKKRAGILPLNPADLFKTAKSYLGARDASIRLGIFLDPRLADELIDELLTLFEPTQAKARVFVHVLSEDMALGEQVSYDALLVVLHAPDMAHTLVSQAREQELPLLLIAEEGLRHDVAQVYGLSILDVATARKAELLKSQVAAWFAENLSDFRLALAADFAFMRAALATATIMSTARQNAVIAFVFLIPGADLPALTLNQAKMVLQLALIYGKPLNLTRALEILVVGVAAFASRSLARALSARVPQLSWPIRAAVAFASTFALGQATVVWLEQGSDLDVLLPLFADKQLAKEAGSTTPVSA